MSVTSAPLPMSSRARLSPTFPAPAMRTYTRRSPLPERRRLDHVDGRLGGRDDVEALLGVPGRPARVEHAGHDLGDVEAPLGDLGDHEVGVVAVRGGDDHVGVLDARLEEGVDLERGAHGEASAAILPGALERIVEALV